MDNHFKMCINISQLDGRHVDWEKFRYADYNYFLNLDRYVFTPYI